MKHTYLVNRALVVVTAVVALLMAGLPVGQAMAQATTSYTSQLTGDVVSTTGPWTIDMDSTGAEGGAEIVAAIGQYDGVLISWLPSGTDLVAGRDYMLGELNSFFDTVVPIDKGAYGSVSYSLDLASSEGIEFGVFSLFLGQRPSGYVEYYLYMGPVVAFTNGFASAQQNITVGGKHIFEGVDGTGLQNFLNQHAGEAGGTATQPSANVVAGDTGQQAPPPTQAPAPTQAPVSTQAPVNSGSTNAEGDAYIQALRGEIDYLQGTLDDFIVNFAALQGDTSGTAVQEINRVSEAWLGYADRAAGIVAPAGYEEIDAAYRTLAGDVGTLGTDWRQFVTVLQQKGDTEQAMTVFIDDMNTVQTELDQLTTMLDGQAPGASSAPVETPVPTETAPTEVAVATEPAATEVANGASSKGSTKTPAGGIAAGNETETGKGGQTQAGQPASGGDFADLGLVEDGQYVSPQTGVEVTWNDTWFFDESYETPISSNTDSGLDSVTISWATDPSVSMFVTVGAAGGTQPADFAALWTSADFLAENADPDVEVLANEASRSGSVSVLVRDYLDNGTEVIIMRSAACGDANCETIVLTTMIGLPDSFADAYQDARGGIEVGGARLLDALTPRTVTNAIAGS